MLTLELDIDAIREGLARIVEPGGVFEIRALGVRDGRFENTYSGYFDDVDAAATAAAGASPRARGVYVTLHALDPALLARRANRLERAGRDDPATSDRDVRRLRWLPIDVDAVRAKGISATDDEHRAALERGRAIAGWLRDVHGWESPTMAGSSGNGCHLLYPVDLAPEDGDLLKRVLEAISEEHSDDRATVDRKVFNPSRIWRVPGTWARKGDDTPERPHRIARTMRYVPPEGGS